MQYAIRHITQFCYEAPISESIMEVRLCPRTDAQQQCYSFDLEVTPHARLFEHRDFLGNTVHHFNLPGDHEELLLEARALVEVRPAPVLPEALAASDWEAIDALARQGDAFEMTMPSAYARPTKALRRLADELDLRRRGDPLSLLRELNAALYRVFAYNPQSTHVNSPIDDALRSRSGVCQDFAHIFIALARLLHVPARYVSGYLFHRPEGSNGHDRSAEDGSHAWAEVCLPELGWVGFDPTNDVLAGERHIRVALGRDYADVPPTRGVFKGSARSTLRVGVRVAKAQFPVRDDVRPELALVVQGPEVDAPVPRAQHQMQSQQ